MSKIKLIAMDLDGTLFLPDHHTISQRNIDALMRARQSGIKTVIATGRTYSQVTEVLEQTNGMSYVLVSNGAAAMDSNGVTIFSNCMEYDEWKKVYDILTDYGIVTEVYQGGKTYLTQKDFAFYDSLPLPKQLIEDLKNALTFCDDVTKVLYGERAEKLTSLYVPPEKDGELRQKFTDMGMSVTSSIPMNIEITKQGVNKASGLKGLCDTLGIQSSEVMAFGDGENDVEMLEWAGHSYAMENACEQAKTAAKHTAPSNAEDGIAQIVEKIL
jgi:hypothetical protein